MQTPIDSRLSTFGSAQEEADYNAWLSAKVNASLADSRPLVPHDEVMAKADAIIEEARLARLRSA